MYKRFFVESLEQISAQLNIEVKNFCDDWLLEFYINKQLITRTIGYNFDLNSAVSQALVCDKVLTYQILDKNKISAIPHFIIYGDFSREKMFLKTTLFDDVKNINIKYPLVMKPNNGTSGKDVFLVNNLKELKSKIIKISKFSNIAICPYFESKYEYRFYILDQEILLSYKKTKDKDWRHNLSCGAKPLVFDSNLKKYQKLSELAKNSLSISSLRFGAVDILQTKKGYMVLEINSGIAMDNFSLKNKKYKKLAKDLHERLFLESIKNDILV